VTDPDEDAPISRPEPRRRARRAWNDRTLWPGWTATEGRFGSEARRLDTFEQPEIRKRCVLSWGRAEDHGVYGARGQALFNGQWGTGGWGPGVRWFVDLEVFTPDWPSDPESKCACHIERGYRTCEEMMGAVAWLRSCVEVAGEEGLRALNARTGGRLA